VDIEREQEIMGGFGFGARSAEFFYVDGDGDVELGVYTVNNSGHARHVAATLREMHNIYQWVHYRFIGQDDSIDFDPMDYA
jgi:hypothetical protein